MSETLLSASGLKKYFPVKGGRQLRAVNDVSFSIAENEIFGVVGESGCGKSTLGRLSLRLIQPTAGSVFFRGHDLSALKRNELMPMRKAMQMVFQNPFASFNPKMRIGSALTEVCGYYGMKGKAASDRIAELFAGTGLSADMLARMPNELSGGQLQRLAIARALLSNPSLIVADEPLSALDVSVQAQLLNLLRGLRDSGGMAMMFISHDMTVVEYLCDRIAVMYLGEIVETAPTAALFGNTLHPYTRSLIAAVPRIDGRGDADRSAAIKGEPPNPAAKITGCPFAPRCPDALPRCREEEPELKEVSPGHLLKCFVAS